MAMLRWLAAGCVWATGCDVDPREGREAEAPAGALVFDAPCPAAPIEVEDQSRSGACQGRFDETATGPEAMAGLKAVIWHEAQHVADRLRDGETSGLLSGSDSELVGVLDSGFVVGEIGADGVSVCATLVYRCWTGGHGSFGYAALDGTLSVRVEGARVSVTGHAGLLGGGALSGTPSTDIEFEWVTGE